MRRYLLSVCIILCYVSAVSQTYSHIIKLNNGNFVCGGYITTDSTANDFVITCVSKQGEVIWKHLLGGSKDDGGPFSGNREFLCQTPDGGVFFAGASSSTDGDMPPSRGGFDIFLARFDVKGNLIWEDTYGGNKTEYLSGIAATPDSGCIISATTFSDDNGDVPANHSVNSSDIWIVKLNANGDIEWSKTYGGSGNEEALSIKTSGDGNYIFTGNVASADGDLANTITTGVWVVEIDNTGMIRWNERMVLK
jgi:hypothetical protein